jgi:hypothetical protein
MNSNSEPFRIMSVLGGLNCRLEANDREERIRRSHARQVSDVLCSLRNSSGQARAIAIAGLGIRVMSQPSRTYDSCRLALKICREEVERFIPCFLSRLAMKPVGCGFVVKAVLRPRINFIDVRLIVFFHRFFGGGNIRIDTRIFFAVMGEHRRLNVFHQLDRFWAATVKDHRLAREPGLQRRRSSRRPSKSRVARTGLL